jgi:RNA polymerase sigma factor (sigma-70 family)
MDAGRAVALELRLEGALVQETFEDVFRRTLPRAIRVARRILGDETLAEDAAAEALARAHAAWRKVGSQPYCEAWILRVTANVAVDLTRKRRRTDLLPLDDARDLSLDADREDRHLSHLDLADALASLPKRQREVVVLQHLQGFSEAEVAEALGVSVGTVKKNGFRAREAMRKRLGRDPDYA